MKQVSIFAILFALLCISSCSKDATTSPNNNGNNNTSTAASFTWTYAGATTTANSIQTFKAFYDTAYHQQNYPSIVAKNGSQTIGIRLSAITVGTYSDQTPINRMEYGGYDMNSFSVVISSNSNNIISGSFSGFYDHQQMNGTFSNLSFQ